MIAVLVFALTERTGFLRVVTFLVVVFRVLAAFDLRVVLVFLLAGFLDVVAIEFSLQFVVYSYNQPHELQR